MLYATVKMRYVSPQNKSFAVECTFMMTKKTNKSKKKKKKKKKKGHLKCMRTS